MAVRLRDGRIAAVLRGGGPHLSIHGRLDMIFSSDEGKTWTKPSVVVDSPIDDRNPAFGEADDGTLVIGFWRTATYDEQGHYNPKLVGKERSTWVTRSQDGGQTWSEPAEIEVSDIGLGSPYGRIINMPDGAMLMAIYGNQIRAAGEQVVGDRLAQLRLRLERSRADVETTLGNWRWQDAAQRDFAAAPGRWEDPRGRAHAGRSFHANGERG